MQGRSFSNYTIQPAGVAIVSLRLLQQTLISFTKVSLKAAERLSLVQGSAVFTIKGTIPTSFLHKRQFVTFDKLGAG